MIKPFVAVILSLGALVALAPEIEAKPDNSENPPNTGENPPKKAAKKSAPPKKIKPTKSRTKGK